MATCYICGKSHAEYRRSVYTGNSNRIGVSTRGNVHTSTDEFQALGKTFGNRIQQEMGILAAKGDLLNATFNNKVVHTVEECDNILKTLKTLESEVNAQTKELQALCNDYIKQCKKFDFGNEFMDNFLNSVEGVRSQ